MRRVVALIAGVVVAVVGLPSAASAGGPGRGEVATVTGELQRLAVDLLDGSALEIAVVVPERGHAVRVQSADVVDVATGSVVEVEVIEDAAAAQDVVAVDGGVQVEEVDVLSAPEVDVRTMDLDAAGLAAAVDGGTRPVAVATGRFTGQAASGVTTSTLSSDITNSVSPYWSESTGGRLSFSVARSGDLGTYGNGPSSSAGCTTTFILAVLDWATNGLRAWEIGDPYHVVLYTPQTACGFAGVAHVSDGGTAWINGASNRWQTIAHELGHTLTLGHSDTLVNCAGQAQDGAYELCKHGEYGDAYDVMGTGVGGPGLLSGAQLDGLGLVPANAMVTVTDSRKVTLAPVGGMTGQRFLRFSTGGATYYVEYRAKVGRDGDLGTTRRGCPSGYSGCTQTVYQPGVIVRRVDHFGDGESTYLLDADTSAGWFALDAGETFRTADFAVTVKVVSTSSTAATVAVTTSDVAPVTPYAQLIATPDVTGNRVGDLFAVDQANRLYLFGGIGGGRVALAKVYDTDWSGRKLYAPGDWNGDARADLVSVDGAGDLWLHAGTGAGGLRDPGQIGFGWTGYRIVPAGDMNGDRKNDLLAIDSAGRLWLYPGTGVGTFGRRIQVGNGWKGFELYAAGDANRDGRNDILSIDSKGRLYYYAGIGGGYFATRRQVGHGWTGFAFASGADLNTDGYGDLVGRDRSGRLWFYAGRFGGTFAKALQIGAGW